MRYTRRQEGRQYFRGIVAEMALVESIPMPFFQDLDSEIIRIASGLEKNRTQICRLVGSHISLLEGFSAGTKMSTAHPNLRNGPSWAQMNGLAYIQM